MTRVWVTPWQSSHRYAQVRVWVWISVPKATPYPYPQCHGFIRYQTWSLIIVMCWLCWSIFWSISTLTTSHYHHHHGNHHQPLPHSKSEWRVFLFRSRRPQPTTTTTNPSLASKASGGVSCFVLGSYGYQQPPVASNASRGFVLSTTNYQRCSKQWQRPRYIGNGPKWCQSSFGP